MTDSPLHQIAVTPVRGSSSVPALGLCVLAGLLFGALPGAAMVYAPISDAELFSGADRVVLGEVVEVRDAADASMPSVDYVIWIEEEFRSSNFSRPVTAPTVTVRVPGGRRDDGMAMWIPGTPKLRVGERLLLFLAQAEREESRLSQHTLGLFHVVDVGGRELAVRALGDAATVFLADTEGQTAKGLSRSIEPRDEWPRDLAGFTRWMRSGAEAAADSAADSSYEVDPKSLGPAFADKFSLLLSRADTEFGGCGETGGRPVRRYDFDEPSVPVGWRLHFAAPLGSLAALREALDAWTEIPASSIEFTFDGLTSANGVLRTPDQTNAVRFGDPFDDMPGEFEGSGLLALGGPWFFCDLAEHRGQEFHPAVEGDIVIQNGVPEALAATLWPERLMVQLLAHELGHTLGIGHSEEPQTLMQALLHLDPRGASFEPDDLAAIEYLYGIGPDATAAPPVPEAPDFVTDRGPFVHLFWPPVEGASNYRVEKRRFPGHWQPAATVVEPEFEDVYVDPEAPYDYRLRSQNAAGASGSSEWVRVSTGPEGTPVPPSQLRVYSTDERGVGLRWQSNSCEVETQRLGIDSGDGFQTLLTTLDGTRTEILLTGLRDDIGYGFRITAENRWGSSLPSEAMTIEPLASQGACTWHPGDSHLCLDERRYELTLEFWDRPAASWRAAAPRPETNRRGFFTFFDTNNLEVEVSIDRTTAATPVLRWTNLTDLAWRVEVNDTVTGESWSYVYGESMCIGSLALAPTSTQEAMQEPKLLPQSGDWQLVSEVRVAVDKLDVPVGGVNTKAIPPSVPCGRAPTDLYLVGGRFMARLEWWDAEGVRRDARALDFTNLSGGFEMSTNDELGWLVKLVDGRGLNGQYWLFAGPMHASAAFAARLEITDLQAGVTRAYRRGRPPTTSPGEPLGCSVGDVAAFDG